MESGGANKVLSAKFKGRDDAETALALSSPPGARMFITRQWKSDLTVQLMYYWQSYRNLENTCLAVSLHLEGLRELRRGIGLPCAREYLMWL